MIRVLIIDDEYLVRKGIRETIDWMSYNVEIVAEADNGQKGLDLARELNPDLIISDIKMPVLNGVELVKKIREENLKIAVIVLSGYRDFDYAKEALENGAYHYLLKPIDNQELIKTVLQVNKTHQTVLRKDRVMDDLPHQIKVLKDSMFESFIHQTMDIKTLKSREALYQFNIPQKGYILMIHPENNHDDHLALYIFKNALIALNDLSTDLFVHIYQNQLFLFLDTISADFKVNLVEALDLYEKHTKSIISVFINKYIDLDDLMRQMIHLIKQSKLKTYDGFNRIFYLNEKVVLHKPIISKAITYIANHYHERITAKVLTDYLFISESYLLHMFKDELGVSFNEYLTNYRMKVAKDLLKYGAHKVYEVAIKVGYKDVKYFTQVFKKHVGLTPSEYINETL